MTLLAACALANAQPVNAPRQEVPLREVQVASGSFSRGAPVPAWVQRVPVPDTNRSDPIVMRLADAQVRLAESASEYVELAIQVNDAAALNVIGQFQLAYDPTYQKLHLHAIGILRGGSVLDRTASANLRFLERETGLERGVYSGAVTVAIVLPDVRVGDTLQLAFTTEGANPIFGNVYADLFAWDGAQPIERRRVTVSYPVTRDIRWRMLGDYRKTAVDPGTTVDGNMRRLQFDERGIEALPAEPFVPDNYVEHRRLQLTEFRDWNQVARWAQSLFPPVDTLSDELQTLVARFAALPDERARAAAALRWVQEEVRYFSLSLGESSHRPHAPDVVLQRRYGDCKDKTYLLLTMLQRMGIEATPILVSSTRPRTPGKLLPAPRSFDHVVLQARIGGALVYLDATRPPQPVVLTAQAPLPPQTLGLLAAQSTRDLVAVGPPVEGATASVEVEERLRLPALAAEGTMEARVSFTGLRADVMRFVWARARAAERRQMSLSYYERRYPGIELADEPQSLDDVELNRFTITSRYKVPKLARSEDGDWRVAFAPWNLQGGFNVPESLQRKFPLAATDFPMERQYKVVVEWPQQVSATWDPSSQVLDGLVFRAESRSTFRGNRSEYTIRLQTKTSDVNVDELPRLMDDLRKLGQMAESGATARRRDIAAEAMPGLSSAQASVVRRARDMVDRATTAIRDKGLTGEDLVEALCLRARGLGHLGQVTDGLRDAAEAVRIAPTSGSAWNCHGDLLYRSGDFQKADAAFTRAMLLGDDESDAFYDRGMARYYAGRFEEAAADFGKAATAAQDNDAALYARLWQTWATQRAGRPPPTDLLAVARRDPKGAWPRPALAMLVGDLTPQAVLAEVDRLQGDERELALAEAWFYVGQHQLVQGRVAEARESFEKCRAIGIITYNEHVGAGFELVRLGAPPAVGR